MFGCSANTCLLPSGAGAREADAARTVRIRRHAASAGIVGCRCVSLCHAWPDVEEQTDGWGILGTGTRMSGGGLGQNTGVRLGKGRRCGRVRAPLGGQRHVAELEMGRARGATPSAKVSAVSFVSFLSDPRPHLPRLSSSHSPPSSAAMGLSVSRLLSGLFGKKEMRT